MAIEQIPKTLQLRKLTVFEAAGHVDFREREARIESNVVESAKTLAKDVVAIEQSIVNQVKRHKIISGGKIGNLKKVTVNDVQLRAHLLNAFGFTYFKGKKDARQEVEASLGHKVNVRGFTNFQDITDLTPAEALEEFGRRQLVSKSEFTKMMARERARSFTVAGVVEKDLLNSTRLLVSKAIDQGWSISDFQRGLREANVKYTGTAFGTAAKAGDPIKPFHAETILRTNFTTIYNRGRLALMNDPDVVEFVPAYQYSAILDNRTRETHAFMDGRIYLRDDPIWDEWTPANGFNCLLSGSNVSTEFGTMAIETIVRGDEIYTHLGNYKRVIGVHKNWYEGDIYNTMLSSGDLLNCTPNHQVLTENGWKRVDQLGRDDYIKYYIPKNYMEALLGGIDHITITRFKGYVYNLSVEDDESYIANNIAVHNCRCMIIPVTSNIPFVVSRPTKVEPDPGFSGSVVLRPAA